MTTDNVWETFPTPNSGEYPDRQFKFDTVGVSIVGTITNIRKAEFEEGKPVPELWLATDEGETSVLCGQFNLMNQLLELRPMIGDRIAITFTGTAPAKKGTAKKFDVAVARAGEGEPVVAAPSAPKTAADLL
jgi:hypothetical protein